MRILTILLAASMAACSTNTELPNTADTSTAVQNQQAAVNMFGGPTYSGEPALAVTAALVDAGGGSEDFSFAAALVVMLGEQTVNHEVSRLTSQYGASEVNTFIAGMDLAINYSLKRAGEAGISLPEPAPLTGVELAETLVNAGVAPDGNFWSGYLFDKAISNSLHIQVMADINASAGYQADEITHKILNRAMYDVAQALGMTHVGLASLH